MRTKTLLLTAAAIAAGVFSSQAQTAVFSQNAVGYVNVTVRPGYNLIANPLNGTNNLLSTVIPTAPDGSTVFKWNNGAQQFAQADTFLGGAWLDSGFNPSTTVVNPGEGIFFQNNSGANATITFVGEVPQGNLTNNILANFGFYSSIVPQSAGLSTIGFPGVDGMTYNAWDVVNQQYAQALTFLGGQWLDGSFNPADPTPAVAEGFLISNPGSAVAWARTFSVNNP
jgi:hypothetical protein